MKEATSSIILHIDDDADDLSLLQEVINRINSTYQIIQAIDGEQGLKKLSVLKEQGTLPCLIVLDVNMPRLDGRQTFVRIREDEQLHSIPIVVFSTSRSTVDKLFFQGKRVEYITKPYSIIQLEDVARKLLKVCEE